MGGDPEAERFMDYARDCCADVVQNWNLDDPWHTWALRNAEHITPQALGLFLLLAPDHAPAGTRETLRKWADRTIQLSDNLWHYRKHSETQWAHPKSKEVGTVAGLAGSLFLAGHVLNDPRLVELAWSNVGFLFGANQMGKVLGSASVLRIHNGGLWPGIAVEDYWPTSHPMGTGRLGGCRGTFEGSPVDEAFPFAPEKFNNPEEPWYASEGWSITNRAWLAAVAFSSTGKSRLFVKDAKSGTEITQARSGQEVVVELEAPIAGLEQSITFAGVWEFHNPADSLHELILEEIQPHSGRFRRHILVPYCPEGIWRLTYGAWGLGTKVTIHVEP